MAQTEQPVVQLRLEVDRKRLTHALRQIKGIEGFQGQPAKMTFSDGRFHISFGGCSFAAEATGDWTGEVEVPEAFVRRITQAPLPGFGPVVVTTDGTVLKIAGIVTNCRWNALVYPRIELPLGTAMLDVLLLPKKYSAADIERSGLTARLREAELERDKIFQEVEKLLRACADEVEKLLKTCAEILKPSDSSPKNRR